jgi:hypothetical protein
MTNTSWTEATTRYNNRPAIDGAVLATRGAVRVGEVVDFDVTAAVLADGAYSFGMVTTSADAAGYNSREASSGRPQLILTLKQNTGPVVNITATSARCSAGGTTGSPGVAVDVRRRLSARIGGAPIKTACSARAPPLR